jgi:hypothetical protein
MKLVGQIIELDPEKKWIAIFDQNYFTRETANQALNAMKKGEGGILIPAGNLKEAITFVENTDKVIDMVINNGKTV